MHEPTTRIADTRSALKDLLCLLDTQCTIEEFETVLEDTEFHLIPNTPHTSYYMPVPNFLFPGGQADFLLLGYKRVGI